VETKNINLVLKCKSFTQISSYAPDDHELSQRQRCSRVKVWVVVPRRIAADGNNQRLQHGEQSVWTWATHHSLNTLNYTQQLSAWQTLSRHCTIPQYVTVMLWCCTDIRRVHLPISCTLFTVNKYTMFLIISTDWQSAAFTSLWSVMRKTAIKTKCLYLPHI